MKKIRYLSLIAIVLIVLTGCGEKRKENPKETILLKDDLNVEINSEVKLLSLLSENNKVEIVNGDETIDTSILGEKVFIIKYKDNDEVKEYNFQINVVDTQSPTIEYKKELTTTAGTKIDLIKDVKVQDNSKESIQVSVEGEYDFNKQGVYNLKYVAIDSSNNERTEDFTLKVNKKPTPTSSEVTIRPIPLTKEEKEALLTRIDLEQLQKETYYIDEHLDRYLSYINLHPTKDMQEVIRSVNANIDYSFYTNTVNADLNDRTLLLVNKYSKLDSSYVPDLVSMGSGYTRNNAKMSAVAYPHFVEMVDAAKLDGIKLFNVSAYRSYQTQNSLYTNYARNEGTKAADTHSARPGYSEHQTGLATDINTASFGAHFENTKEYQWLINNSYKYGFILRYPKGKEYITGYSFEPWHYRYVGVEVATYIHENQITYDEYYAYFIKNK